MQISINNRKPEEGQGGRYIKLVIVAKGKEEFRKALDRLKELVGPDDTVAGIMAKKK